jgi:hypothetical protein
LVALLLGTGVCTTAYRVKRAFARSLRRFITISAWSVGWSGESVVAASPGGFSLY